MYDNLSVLMDCLVSKLSFSNIQKKYYVRSGIRTHAHICGLEISTEKEGFMILETMALHPSAILTISFPVMYDNFVHSNGLFSIPFKKTLIFKTEFL